jgi:SprT protein
MTTEPLDPDQRQQVRDATAEAVERASDLYRQRFPTIRVSFDLCGTSAGMYRARRGDRCIRYNPWIFARYFDDSLTVTVPHEVAHYVTDCLHGLSRVRPHGPEWRAVMRELGADPRVTGRYDLSGLPLRRQRRFDYRCDCRSHQLSAARHNRVQRGEVAYLCRACRTPVVFAGSAQATAR